MEAKYNKMNISQLTYRVSDVSRINIFTLFLTFLLILIKFSSFEETIGALINVDSPRCGTDVGDRLKGFHPGVQQEQNVSQSDNLSDKIHSNVS